MIGPGTVCVWQNVTSPEWSYLNGTETTVLRGLHFAWVQSSKGYPAYMLVYRTDTQNPDHTGKVLAAAPHELRPKNPDTEDFEASLSGFVEKAKREMDKIFG